MVVCPVSALVRRGSHPGPRGRTAGEPWEGVWVTAKATATKWGIPGTGEKNLLIYLMDITEVVVG